MRKKFLGEDVENYVAHCPYILALVPYRDGKSSSWTRVYYFGGKSEDYHHRLEKILDDLAATFRTSVEVLRRRIVMLPGNGKGQRKIPIVLIKGFCLMPLKVADLYDGTKSVMGYVAYHYIERVQELPGNRCEIYFKDGLEPLMVNQSIKSVREQMKLARKLEKAVEAEDAHWKYEFCIAAKFVTAWRTMRRKTVRKMPEIG